MHNPNPFDFVPFQDCPTLRTAAEFDDLGETFTGYLEATLTALTPVHVVGTLGHRHGWSSSKMERQNGTPCIPAATIRGSLRAFIEALTSGWVSQATPEYEKKPDDRHVGFATFDAYENRGKKNRRRSPPAVDPAFRPAAGRDQELDVASYLFGIVIEAQQAAKDDSYARKGKVWVEDALIHHGDVKVNGHWVPELEGDPFMGGASPSASNWWYFEPDEIWKRTANGRAFAEFIGKRFRGRKFYFHQDPTSCIEYYHPDSLNWAYRDHPFHQVMLECLQTDQQTDRFRIYVDRLPKPFLRLLVLAIAPGANIRHKLGYGKAYGYGSIEYSISAAQLRRDNETSAVPTQLQDSMAMVNQWITAGWDVGELEAANLEPLIDRTALTWLAKILGRQNVEGLLFTYPPYEATNSAEGFKRSVFFDRLQDRLPDHLKFTSKRQVSSTEARQIAEKLWGLKNPVDFRLYQEKAEHWATIEARTP